MSNYERPLPLITLNKNNQFVVGEEALKMISSLEGDIAVVAVAGLYRTGKSYILNRLLGRQEAFEIGPTVNPCTKGIYTWGQPLVKEANGRKLNIVLVDTEGIGSVQQDQTYDAKIFSLAILLSSYFIYNSMGVIDERALDQLSLVVELTKHISVKSDGKNASPSDFASYFPNFLWLLRDFALELIDEDNNVITPTQYLENALREMPGAHQSAKNEIRRSIKNFFTRRDCVTLVRPVVDERDLRKIDKLKWNQMRPEFQQQVNNLVKKVFSEITPKQIHGKNVTGRAYGAMIKAYVDAINKGTVPNINNTWDSVANIENHRTVEECFHTYKTALAKEVNGKLPMDEAVLRSLSDKHKAAVMVDFQARVLGDFSGFKKKLVTLIDQEFKRISDANHMESSKLCQQLLTQLITPLRQKSNKQEWKSPQEIVDAWLKFQQDYIKSARGPTGEVMRALVEFEAHAFGPIWLSYLAHVSSLAQEKLEEQRKKEEALKKRMEQLVENAHKYELNLVKEQEKSQNLEATVKRLEASLAQVTMESESVSKKLKAAQDQIMELTKQTHKLEADAARDKNRLEQEIIRLTAANETASLKNDGLEKERQKLHEQLEQMKQALQLSKQWQLDADSLRETLAKRDEELEKLRKEADSQQAELNKLVNAEKGRADKLEKELAKLRPELERGRVENKKLQEQVEQMKQSSKQSQLDAVSLRETLAKREEELEKLRKEADSQQAELNKLVNAEKGRADKLEKELAKLRPELERGRVENKKLQDQVEQMKQSSKQSQLDAVSLRETLAKREEELEKMRQEAAAQRAELTKFVDEEKSRADGLEKELAKLRPELERGRIGCQKLQEQVEQMKKALQSSKQSQLDAASLREALVKREEELEKMRQEAAAQQAELNNLVNAEKSRADGLEKELTKLRFELEREKIEYQQQLQDQAEQMKQALYSSKQAQLDADSLREELAKRDEELEKLRKEADTQWTDLNKLLNEEKSRAAKLEEELSKLRAELELLRVEKQSEKTNADKQEEPNEIGEEQRSLQTEKVSLVKRGRRASTTIVQFEVDDNKENEPNKIEEVSNRASKTVKATPARKTSTRVRRNAEDEERVEEPTPRGRGKRKRVDINEDQDTEVEHPAKRQRIDPNKLTKAELKQILTQHNVKLPTTDQLKRVYVDLYLSHVASE